MKRERVLLELHVNHAGLDAVGAEWAKPIPTDMRNMGVRETSDAITSNEAKAAKCKQDNKKAHHYKLKHRSKKDAQEALTIHSKHWAHKRGCYVDLFGSSFSKLKCAVALPEKVNYDCKLVRTRLGEYYLCIPGPLETVSDIQAPLDSYEGVVGLDPGVRTFMTVFSADAEVVEWGVGDTTRIHRLCVRLDKLQSKWSQPEVRHRQRYRMKRAAMRMRKQIRSSVDEVHCKLAKWLCENFRVVLIPSFDTQQMVSGRLRRKISSKTARSMCTWSHYRFRQRLMNKAREYPWVRIVTVTEEFTSKTCGMCGVLNEKLGGSKTFLCEQCGYQADRDHNGARNVLIKHAQQYVDCATNPHLEHCDHYARC